jgi:hypothetical protein
VGTLRFWARRREEPPPLFYEPTPYCDRLTLAEPFGQDRETRANAEDLRGERLRVVEAATSSLAGRSRR